MCLHEYTVSQLVTYVQRCLKHFKRNLCNDIKTDVGKLILKYSVIIDRILYLEMLGFWILSIWYPNRSQRSGNLTCSHEQGVRASAVIEQHKNSNRLHWYLSALQYVDTEVHSLCIVCYKCCTNLFSIF